jgi:hypothetical protein
MAILLWVDNAIRAIYPLGVMSFALIMADCGVYQG